VIEAGVSTGTSPVAGTSRPEGSRITLQISSGPRTKKVPSLVGIERASAQNQLTDAGFKVSIIKVDSDQPEDTVTAQDPAAGTAVDEGSTVTLSVSNGKLQPQRVPNVGGLDEAHAVGRLKGAGFDVRVHDQRVGDPSEDGIVLDQSPTGGEQLAPGGKVEIQVGRLDTSGGTPR
jgi:serine/threonine-protein kinase